MRRYYEHKRHNGIIYAELIDQKTGRKLPARSTGTRDHDEALLIIADWLANGIKTGKEPEARPVEMVSDIKGIIASIRKADLSSADAMRIVKALTDSRLIDLLAVPVGDGSVDFIAYLLDFWQYETSEYLKERISHGHNLTKRHCHECTGYVKLHWKPFFKERKLNTITLQDLKSFSQAVYDKGLAAGTINHILNVGKKALKEAYRKKLIPYDPTDGLTYFAGRTKKRGVLTPQEAQALFAQEWENKRTYVGNLLAITTGLRNGEVLAVRKCDIGESSLSVRHSWSRMDKLKSTKTGEERKVPLLPKVRELLLELAAENPFGNEDSFVFFSDTEDEPMKGIQLLYGLKIACEAAHIDYEGRNIVFHSHRHFYAARMVDVMRPEQVSRVTGHKSKAVFEEYAAHVTNENLAEMLAASSEVFGNIVMLGKGA